MKSYLIFGLSKERIKQLDDARVGYERIKGTVRTFFRSGLLFDQANFNRMLEILNAVNKRERRTSYVGVVSVKLRFNPILSEAAQKQADADKKASQGRSRQKYIEVCQERIAEGLESAKTTFEENTKVLGNAEDGFLRWTRTACFGNANFDVVGKDLAAELERLRENPKVLDVRVTRGFVHVFTDTLYATNPDTKKVHEIGKFMLSIATDGKNGAVRWHNGTRRVDGVQKAMNAPNVFADGTGRVDDLRETLIELIARFELSIVAELAIQFIETVTDDEIGKFIVNWPLAKNQG